MIRNSLLIVVTLVFISLSVVALRYKQAQRAQRKREAIYQTTLQSYLKVFKLGITRKNMEDYLRRQGTAFQQMCCIEGRSAFADLVKIGSENHPWFCSEHNVYIAFQFAAMGPHTAWQAYDSDVLQQVTIFHWAEGCL